MRVLFAHDGPLYRDSSGNHYGIHTNETLRRRYMSLGNSVTFLMRVYNLEAEPSGRFSILNKDNLEVVPVPNFKSLRGLLLNYDKAKRVVQSAVRQHDIIVARMPSAVGTLAVEYARAHKKPYLVEFVACTFDAYWNYGWKGKLIAHYKLFRQKRIVKQVPYIIYVTKDFLQIRYPSRGKQIHCSNVELTEVNERVLDRRLKKIQAYDKRTILTFATIAAVDVPYKGQSDVLEALTVLNREGILFRYFLVGQGDAGRMIKLVHERQLEASVTILGAIRHEDVFKFLDDVDVYIQPSKQEGLPRSVIEAMSRGCPVIGSDAGGIPELLGESMVYKAGHVRQLTEKLRNIKKEELLEQACRNFEHAQHYRKEVLYRRRNQFYFEFLQEANLPIPTDLRKFIDEGA